MAKNKNPKLQPSSCFVTGTTGAGKSQMIKELMTVKFKAVKRWVVWDPDEDHPCRHFRDREAFTKALKVVMEKGGCIGWNGAESKDDYDWFMMTCWAALDGFKKLGIVTEEAADIRMGSKDPTPWAHKVLIRGRKYGAVLITATQRVQEVPKTYLTQCHNRYVGRQQDTDAIYCARVLKLDADKLEALPDLTFFHKYMSTVIQKKIKYRG